MMIKMVVTDLDETLLRSDKSISDYTIEIIEKVRHTGIKVIFATARGGSTKRIVPYDLFDGYVLLNGAKAYVGNRLVYDRDIPSDVYIPFLQYLSKHHVKVAAEINGIHYANYNVKSKWNYIDHFVMTDYIDVSGGADKLYAIIEDPEQIDIINSILPEELYLNVSRDGLAMIMHKEATKSNGILKIAEAFNISKDGIIAFGDDVNDKDMLLNCGLSIAMDNAIDEIKAIADYICDSNNHDGVAKWLVKNILEINRDASGAKKF